MTCDRHQARSGQRHGIERALGYTLSDRTTRYDEAKTLIEQAHQLSPEDPAVLDSLGWG